MRFATQPVGAEWFDDNVPCTRACPVLTNAGRYVTAIAAGDDELAYRIARLPNPFPSICGRVCAAPCEVACRRGAIDEPIAIRALKRYVTERYGVESGHGNHVYRDAAPTAPARDEKIAMIGAGPAGMACAHDLADLRLPPRRVRGAGPARRHDGPRHPAVPAQRAIYSKTRSARSSTWAWSSGRTSGSVGTSRSDP